MWQTIMILDKSGEWHSPNKLFLNVRDADHNGPNSADPVDLNGLHQTREFKWPEMETGMGKVSLCTPWERWDPPTHTHTQVLFKSFVVEIPGRSGGKLSKRRVSDRRRIYIHGKNESSGVPAIDLCRQRCTQWTNGLPIRS